MKRIHMNWKQPAWYVKYRGPLKMTRLRKRQHLKTLLRNRSERKVILRQALVMTPKEVVRE